MREFILRARKGPSGPNFSLEHLSDAGRLEVVTHCIANALFYSKHIRPQTVMHIVLDGPGDPPKTLRLESDQLPYLGGFDERTLAMLIQRALTAGRGLPLNEERQVDSGIYIAKKAFETLIKEKAAAGDLFYLQKKGQDIRTVAFPNSPTFVFADHLAMPKNTDKYLQRLGAQAISVGPQMLFASHCIVLAHNELDRQKVP
ncbi:MAG: tRNA (pseudouridine(54)-N(1))-methyltransferase TrmY [bacterium]|nr:tRNA (pseudouridine(54)-N(1))-methyltransferase TrmY [bacterium]